MAMAMAMADTSKAEAPKEPEGPPILVAEGFSLYTENNAHILISSKDEAFLNPVQEFNRDMSVACIRVWSEELDRGKVDKFRKAEERRAKRLELATWKKPKCEGGACVCRCAFDSWGGGMLAEPVRHILLSYFPKYHPHKFVLLEALSATGLRSIRYAKEIPLVRFVMEANRRPVL